jgi:hypothetical protein
MRSAASPTWGGNVVACPDMVTVAYHIVEHRQCSLILAKAGTAEP